MMTCEARFELSHMPVDTGKGGSLFVKVSEHLELPLTCSMRLARKFV
jgi:hypothetical protein